MNPYDDAFSAESIARIAAAREKIHGPPPSRPDVLEEVLKSRLMKDPVVHHAMMSLRMGHATLPEALWMALKAVWEQKEATMASYIKLARYSPIAFTSENETP